ncbi:hypothetical protein [Pantoea agglomerans]|uniref:hypothetical protein n=1 Tax=Enterobacter agglomerans TaxID=549 RepID=UPI001ABBCE23|nr:hypothetical protein [Pantoea agglomerans]
MTHPDPIDETAEQGQQMIEIALANRAKPAMQVTGVCYYCEEAVSTGCFCSAECREDYERIERAKQHRKVA